VETTTRQDVPDVTCSPRRAAAWWRAAVRARPTDRTPPVVRAGTVAVAVLALLLTPLPAGTAAASTAPPPAAGDAPAPPAAGDEPALPVATGEGRAPIAGAVPVIDPLAPTAEELQAQRDEAERLDAEVATQARLVSAARARLSDLADAAGESLEAYQTALLAHDAAEADRRAQQARLEAARLLVGQKQDDLGRWASSAYRDGGAMADYETLMTLLDSGTTDELGRRLVMLQRVGRSHGAVVSTVEDAELVQRDASALARAAAAEAALATERATVHRTEAERLVAKQRQQTVVLADLLDDTRGAASQADLATEDLVAARAEAEQRRLAAMTDRRAGDDVTGMVGECLGGDVSRYPNGAIPVSALCEIVPGHHLRADAAFALKQLDAAYTAQWGTSLCLTDSYRTFESQVRLFATKPDLAAVPGTSNHGWGTAVDLCGGIESFGSSTHGWMRDNAPLYGWFHPSWAQSDGSRPEPWHWEFGG